MLSLFQILKRVFSIMFALFNLLNLNAPKTDVELYSNPASGYTWDYEMDNVGILTCSDSRYTADKGSVLTGKGGGTQKFTFKSLSEGTVNITFTYYKYNGLKKEIASTYVYKYVVSADKSIKLISIE